MTNCSINHNTGTRQNMVVQDLMLFKLFDWTIIPIIAFDWLSKNARHSINILVLLACSTVMVLAVKDKHISHTHKCLKCSQNDQKSC